MDIATLLTGNAVLSAASAGVMLMVLRTRKTYAGFGWWTAGVASMAVGAAMFVPGLLPETWLTLTLRNAALLAGMGLILRGMRVFRSLPVGFWPELLVALTFVPLFAHYSQDSNHLAARIVVFSAYGGALALAVVWVTLRQRPAHAGSNDWLLAASLSVFGVLSFIRCVSQILHPTTRAAFDTMTGYQSFYILTQVLTIHLITLALININSQRIEHDLQLGERHLRESEDRLITILDNLGNHVYVKDAGGHYVYVNRLAADQFGRPVSDILGRTDTELLPPDTAHRLQDVDRQVLQSSQPTAREEVLEDRRGHPVHFWSTKQSVVFQGAPALIGVSADISQVRQLEASVRQAKEFSESLIETANVVLLGLDPRGCVLFINAKGEEVTGYPRGDLLGRDWFAKMLDAETGALLRGAFDEDLQGGAAPRQVENTIRTRSGEARQLLWWNSLVRDADGQPIMVSCGIDVTAQQIGRASCRERVS
jgi:PAS domain S-box-containing protein